MIKYLVLDFETRSRCDLFDRGAHEYACDDSTEVLCAAWKFGHSKELKAAPIETWCPFLPDEKTPKDLLKAIFDPSVFITAHNAQFERVILRHVMKKNFPSLPFEELPVERFICTASMARALALPGSLEKASGALRMDVQKDMVGKRAMMSLSIPNKATNEFNRSMETLKTVIEYCKTDVQVQTDLFLMLPQLTEKERRLWLLDQRINDRGFRVDRELVNGAISLIEAQTIELKSELSVLTDGKIDAVTKREQLINFLNALGANMPDLTKARVEAKLMEPGLDPKIKSILEVRQKGSKSSTAKYLAFEARSRHDGRCRENMIYHGASTGRFAGSGVQIHNLPRGTIKVDDEILESIRRGETPKKATLGQALPSSLRSVILPSEGLELFCGDYASIEARQVFWLADHADGLLALRSGRDLYVEMAAYIFKKLAEHVTKDERFLGKSAILGAGYGMGQKKFKMTCEAQGAQVTEELAKLAIEGYRSLHKPVVDLWYKVEQAAVMAVRNVGKIYQAGKCKFYVALDFLFIELPSGRALAYHRPKLKRETTPWGADKLVLYHMGVDQKTRGWVEAGTYGGRLVENICQAVSRDIMAEAMTRLDDAGYRILITVHDEIVAENSPGLGNVKEFESLMSECPTWAQGSAIKVEAWSGPRYKKG